MPSRLGKRSLIGVLAVCLALAAATAGYFMYFKEPPLVRVSAATLAPVAEVVSASGTVEPVQSAKVVPFQRRRLTEICRCEGQVVRRGQILGRQDDTEERGALKELQIRHDQLVRDLDRARRDRDKGSITKAELEQRETAVRESNSRIGAQENRLDTLIIRAPMDGMVLQRTGEVGEIVGPTDVLFSIGQTSRLQVVADINEEEITKVAVGQKAFLTNEAFAQQSLRATVSQITPKGDPTKKTFRVYLTLPQDTPLRIGMTVDTNIVYNEKRAAVVVPTDAVSTGAVQVVRDDQVRRVTVSTGIRGSQFVEITAGLTAGTLVLSPARGELKDGTHVRTERVAAPAAASSTQSDDQMILDSLSRHIQSVVSEARRNASGSR